jgi:hypothetical protein
MKNDIYPFTTIKVNIHTETGGLPIGLELHTQCFAFATNKTTKTIQHYTEPLFIIEGTKRLIVVYLASGLTQI